MAGKCKNPVEYPPTTCRGERAIGPRGVRINGLPFSPPSENVLLLRL